MAAMEEALCAYLLTKTAITDLIGTGNAARLWPQALDEDYKDADGPAAVYELLDSQDDHLLSDRSGIVQTRVLFACYSNEFKKSTALARAIKNSGVATLKGTSGGVDFRGVRIVSGLRTYDENPTDGSKRHRYLSEVELEVFYLEG